MRFLYPAAKLRFVERPPRREEWRELHRAAERHVPDAEKAFGLAIQRLRRLTPLEPIRAALDRDVPEVAVSMFPWAVLERALEDKLLPVLASVASAGSEVAVRGLEWHLRRSFEVKKQEGEIGTAFDLTNPEVAAELAEHGADLVTMLTNESRAAIQEIVLAAQTQGLDIRLQASRIASVLRQSAGLNAPQARALVNYEIALNEAGHTATEIRRLLGLRREKMIQQRARLIARQETLSAARVGQHDTWRQAREQGLLPADQKRKWLTQGELNPNNPCPICSPMNGQIRGMDEPFVSPYNGATSMHGGVHISCECVVTLDFSD